MSYLDLSPEELSDLRDDFAGEYNRKLDIIGDRLVSLYKEGAYQAFLDLIEDAKKFCYSNGPGGIEYFKDEWEDDPRISWSKSSLSLAAKYAHGASLDEICEEILQYICTCKQVLAGDIYKQFQYFQHDMIQKALEKLSRGKLILKGSDKSGRKTYSPKQG